MPRIRLRKKPTRHDLLKLKKQLDLSNRAYHLLEEKQRLLLREYRDTEQQLAEKELETNEESALAFKLLSHAIERNGIQKIRQAAYDTKPNDNLEIIWGSIKGVSIPLMTAKIKLRKAFNRGYSILQTDINLDKVKARAQELGLSDEDARSVDAGDPGQIRELMQGHDVVVNGLPKQFALNVLEAALEAKVSCCDLSSPTESILALDEKAKELEVSYVAGMGATPGVTNLLAKHGVDQLPVIRMNQPVVKSTAHRAYFGIAVPKQFCEVSIGINHCIDG